VGSGYSRCLVPLNNGRLFVIQAGWNGSGLNSVTYGDLAMGCTPTAIVPSIQVNGGSWLSVSSDTVAPGASVVLGPTPNVATGWTWTGPNGFTASTREVTFSSITAAQAGTYTATYTNSSGCKSTQRFTLTVQVSTSILTIRPTRVRGSGQVELLLNRHSNPSLFDRSAEVRIFDLKGVSVYRQTISASGLEAPYLKSGVYVVDVVRDRVLLERKSFIIE